MTASRKAAVIGSGVIGGGWVARFLLNGWDVNVYDPDLDAPRKVAAVMGNARRSLPSLYDRALPEEGRLSFSGTPEDAVSGVDWVQECVPERLGLKIETYARIQAVNPEAVLGSSTSGFRPSQLQEGAHNPENILVTHPFNPVYLLPLVEVVPTAANTAETIDGVVSDLNSIGMKPLVVRKEIDAHIADRMLEAVWREGLWLIRDGICTTGELDDAIRYGFGLRWAQMGLFETYRIAGGEAGMRHFIEQFGPALEWPWTKLMDVPEFTPELVDIIVEQSDAQSGGHSIRELERLRDDNLVGMIRALRASGSGAGGTINEHDFTLSVSRTGPDGCPVTVERQIPQTWTDYNGHMNEANYLVASAQASDRFMEMIGADADYIARGKSYFTSENHLCYLSELKAGERLTVTTQVLVGEGKKMHLLNRLYGEDGELAATVETFLLHVDLSTRATSVPEKNVVTKLAEYTSAHADMPRPAQVGRYVGKRD